MADIRILWVDDEIEVLRPHILFLEQKGFSVDVTNNGSDALEMVHKNPYDIVFLDEQVHGIQGIETLEAIKKKLPGIPVVLITKREEETILEEDSGSNLSAC